MLWYRLKLTTLISFFL